MAAEITPFVKNLHKELTCPICCEVFTEPLTLPCLHSYCSECVYSQSIVSRNGKIFTCPKCETPMNVKPEDCSTLYLNSLLRLLHATGDKRERDQCVSCEKTSRLVAFCPQCKGTICSKCFKVHKTMKQLREEHQAVMLNTLDEKDVDNFTKNQILCKEMSHEKSKMEYYCDTCKRCICQKCCTISHKNHKTDLIAKQAEQAKQVIEFQTNRMKKAIEKLNEELTQSFQYSSRIASAIQKAKQEIEEERKAAIKRVNHHAIIVTQDLDVILLGQQKQIQAQRVCIEREMKKIAEFQEYNKDVLKRNRTLQILESQEGVQFRGHKVERFLELLRPIKRLSVRYTSNKQFEKSLRSIGKVVKTEHDDCSRMLAFLKLLCYFFPSFSCQLKKTIEFSFWRLKPRDKPMAMSNLIILLVLFLLSLISITLFFYF